MYTWKMQVVVYVLDIQGGGGGLATYQRGWVGHGRAPRKCDIMAT